MKDELLTIMSDRHLTYNLYFPISVPDSSLGVNVELHTFLKLRNLKIRERSSFFFQLLTKLFFNFEIEKLSVLIIPIKQLRCLNRHTGYQ